MLTRERGHDAGPWGVIVDKKYRIVLELSGDPEKVRWIYQAILPETYTAPRYRSRAIVELADQGRVIIRILSGDISSLRAAFNTFARLVEVILRLE
jgi:tRNA threonylcarbamoyladenosine modification (KEOPS) complex  Pcc1 subunit